MERAEKLNQNLYKGEITPLQENCDLDNFFEVGTYRYADCILLIMYIGDYNLIQVLFGNSNTYVRMYCVWFWTDWKVLGGKGELPCAMKEKNNISF